MQESELKKKANEIRQDVIKMLLEAKSGHSAGSLGMADVMTALYFGGVLKHDPKKPDWSERDYFILSNAHICPVWYTTLAHAGYFDKETLKTLRKFRSCLQGHPHMHCAPGVENSGGPLGQGLSIAIGLAYGLKMDGKRNQVYCMTGDGEQDEGQMWEAVMFAGKNKMDNLTAIMDRNNIQIDGYTEDVMPLEPLRAKYEAFNWHVIDADGHNIEEIVDACNQAKAIYEKPVMILAHNIPGKGVDFIEFQYSWHGKTPNKEEAAEALKQLRTLGGQIEEE